MKKTPSFPLLRGKSHPDPEFFIKNLRIRIIILRKKEKREII